MTRLGYLSAPTMRAMQVASIVIMALAGSCAKQWTVLHQAHPNVLRNHHDFAIAPLVYDPDIRINLMSEPAYAIGDPEAYVHFAVGKYRMADQLVFRLLHRTRFHITRLEGPTATGAFVIRPRVTALAIGHNYQQSRYSDVHVWEIGYAVVVVQIFGDDGRLVDEVEITARGRASADPSEQMWTMGDHAAVQLDRYLGTRTDP